MSERASPGATGGEVAERPVHPLLPVDPPTIDWVDLSSVPGLHGVAAIGGGLGMTSLAGARSVAGQRGVAGVDALLVLVEDPELDGVALTGEGVDVLRHPIPDMSVPLDRAGLRITLDEVMGRLRAGRTVVVACRAGLGRTGTIVACLLRDGGLDADAAVALTRESRPNTIERESQLEFVATWPGVTVEDQVV